MERHDERKLRIAASGEVRKIMSATLRSFAARERAGVLGSFTWNELLHEFTRQLARWRSPSGEAQRASLKIGRSVSRRSPRPIAGPRPYLEDAINDMFDQLVLGNLEGARIKLPDRPRALIVDYREDGQDASPKQGISFVRFANDYEMKAIADLSLSPDDDPQWQLRVLTDCVGLGTWWFRLSDFVKCVKRLQVQEQQRNEALAGAPPPSMPPQWRAQWDKLQQQPRSDVWSGEGGSDTQVKAVGQAFRALLAIAAGFKTPPDAVAPMDMSTDNMLLLHLPAGTQLVGIRGLVGPQPYVKSLSSGALAETLKQEFSNVELFGTFVQYYFPEVLGLVRPFHAASAIRQVAAA